MIKSTVAGGSRQGVLTGLGHGLGVGIYAFAAVLGVAGLVAASPNLSIALQIAGGGYLIWLGLGALRSRHLPQTDTRVANSQSGFQDGFAVAFLNPKIAVFFLALLGSFLPADASHLERAGVAVAAMTIDAGWYTLVALFLVATGAADWLARRRSEADLVMGILLVGVGGFLAAKGVHALLGS